MITTKAFRVIGLTGVVGAMALLQACAPADNAEESTGVRGQELCTTKGCEDLKDPPKDGKGGQTGPVPPAGYVPRWSTCANYIEGDGNIRTNSRVVFVDPSDGTIPIQRAEPGPDGKGEIRKIKLASLPKPLLGGKGKDRAGNVIEVVKLGQIIQTKSVDGTVTQWSVSSRNLGQPERMRNGQLHYRDSCFRNLKTSGKDTAGRVASGTELAATCIVEDMNMEYNAMSYAGYWPLVNYADGKVGTRHNPASTPHPDHAPFEGFDGSAWYYSRYGASLNDINGTERDEYTNYYSGPEYCHMIVSGGFEVPGSKRPSTKTLPAPGEVNVKTYVAWRPVNPNVNIANSVEPAAPDPVEPAPEPTTDAVPESDTAPY